LIGLLIDLFVGIGWDLRKTGQRKPKAGICPAKDKFTLLASDHLRADKRLERSGHFRLEFFWVDDKRTDDKCLGNIGAALLGNDFDQF